MSAVTDQYAAPSAPVRKTPMGTFDLIFRNASLLAALFVLVLLAGIMLSMVIGGWPAFREFGFGFITSSVWDTQNDQYGAWPAIVGTLSTALIALVVGVPLSLGIAVFLTQLAPPWFKQPVSTAIELLAAVPSIIYGMWGLFVFAPLFAAYVQIPLSNIVEGMPIIGTVLYSRSPSGLGILTAGIILAFMIIPFIASITRDMLDQIPSVLRESAYGIGATTWEVVRHVLVPQAGVSIIGAVMLGLGRALGETMAVTFVVGNANRLSPSILDPGSTIASRIANEFNEALGLQLNSLIALGCILFFVTFVVLVIARLLVARVKRY
ncbi:phosphate transporter subunit; membrane component of ABC superfamily [Bosea sp. 62]|uniref:phosphate ABC transporter permease subunit PstC n=1 Tax=unclassified Bosea (in: a-proteobacteria) TaxID=2653178 RepID=UPI0012533A86|nr:MULTISPECIES: phosphate ABC transporter permease subunit PstC [unclassified Bosea (in: a-proteobacteria)]CAD5285232.1 phosphate transporter subunit; membrane component of ABC superfamily [Bosea sp. 21B]CAD5287923.1 phosphate transporter subunit; membrane component of ABC superfamily [Bosea sp. 46]CAD5301533.1 phosphate transporter subunit; membrane component of ABC superfamily [Bosea sp. 7B]VVT51171.1 phosphate transporter subunit; membrane component of ABC superfamily [Bosea sp. EC-HK365B]